MKKRTKQSPQPIDRCPVAENRWVHKFNFVTVHVPYRRSTKSKLILVCNCGNIRIHEL
jgi:hypothetical protein